VQAPQVEATAALTVVVVGLLTVTVEAHGSALQEPQTVEELLDTAGSALQVPQVVEELVEVAFAGSALQVPQVVELEELLAEAASDGSALHTLQVPVWLAALPELKPPVADLQLELVQVPKVYELARASAPKVNATAVVNFILIIENIGCPS
jgi:hypothetical protein